MPVSVFVPVPSSSSSLRRRPPPPAASHLLISAPPVRLSAEATAAYRAESLVEDELERAREEAALQLRRKRYDDSARASALPALTAAGATTLSFDALKALWESELARMREDIASAESRLKKAEYRGRLLSLWREEKLEARERTDAANREDKELRQQVKVDEDEDDNKRSAVYSPFQSTRRLSVTAIKPAAASSALVGTQPFSSTAAASAAQSSAVGSISAAQTIMTPSFPASSSSSSLFLSSSASTLTRRTKLRSLNALFASVIARDVLHTHRVKRHVRSLQRQFLDVVDMYVLKGRGERASKPSSQHALTAALASSESTEISSGEQRSGASTDRSDDDGTTAVDEGAGRAQTELDSWAATARALRQVHAAPAAYSTPSSLPAAALASFSAAPASLASFFSFSQSSNSPSFAPSTFSPSSFPALLALLSTIEDAGDVFTALFSSLRSSSSSLLALHASFYTRNKELALEKQRLEEDMKRRRKESAEKRAENERVAALICALQEKKRSLLEAVQREESEEKRLQAMLLRVMKDKEKQRAEERRVSGLESELRRRVRIQAKKLEDDKEHRKAEDEDEEKKRRRAADDAAAAQERERRRRVLKLSKRPATAAASLRQPESIFYRDSQGRIVEQRIADGGHRPNAASPSAPSMTTPRPVEGVAQLAAFSVSTPRVSAPAMPAAVFASSTSDRSVRIRPATAAPSLAYDTPSAVSPSMSSTTLHAAPLPSLAFLRALPASNKPLARLLQLIHTAAPLADASHEDAKSMGADTLLIGGLTAGRRDRFIARIRQSPLFENSSRQHATQQAHQARPATAAAQRARQTIKITRPQSAAHQ